MKNNVVLAALLASMLIFAQPGFAGANQENKLNSASEVIEQIMQIPEESIPSTLLDKAYAIAVIPSVIRVGIGFGGRYGRGVLSVRQNDGSWSAPTFVVLAGGSWGLQLGASATDVILVFKSQKGVGGITGGKLTLGGDASVAAGPVGRSTEAATDITFQSEVYSYSRSRGLFAGVALAGAVIQISDKWNVAYYGDENVTAQNLLYSTDIKTPPSARKFMSTLSKYTPELVSPPAAPTLSDSVAEEEQQSVKTYPAATD